MPWKLLITLGEADDVRTFLLWHDAEDDFEPERRMDEKQWEVFTCKLRRLRSLDLHSCKMFKVPRSISKLRHLRDLDLSHNKYLLRLPNSITQLYNLHVLRLKGCSCLIELPTDIHQLINLNQLDLKGCYSLMRMPRGLGKLTSLHILTRFVLSISRAAGLDELHGLNNLRGKLEIDYLIHATFDQLTSSNLKKKKHLQCLTLDWGFYDTEYVMSEDEMTEALKALEALEPHRNLKVLKVVGNKGSHFPKWLSPLTNLVEIEIRSCVKCQYIPPLHQLPYLRRLFLSSLWILEYVDSGNAAQTTSSFFPSLEVLELRDCPKLKGWTRQQTTLESLPRLQILSQLVITGCPNLASMPLFPPLKALNFGGGSVKSLLDILKTTKTAEQIGSSRAAAASSLSVALSQLQELTISEIEDLKFLPEELMCHMGSLKVLMISRCHELKALGRAVGYLTSLETLSLADCKGLKLLEDERDDHVIHWQALRCFRSLILERMPFETLPEWLRHLQTIQELHILHYSDLFTLPAWLVQLTSLERLNIDWPAVLRHSIISKNGEYWPRIAHIPNIKVNFFLGSNNIKDCIVVQRNGRYLH